MMIALSPSLLAQAVLVPPHRGGPLFLITPATVIASATRIKGT